VKDGGAASVLSAHERRKRAVLGPSIQIDPQFSYYRDRSAESVADEIALAGYRIVHYFVVNEQVVFQPLIDAFHDRGISVWAMVIGNGTYSTERFPEEWPSWQMELLKKVDDGFRRFSHFCEPYRQWKKASLARLVAEYAFDGIEIAEPYFPEWGGIERGVYGDVGPHARRAFRERYGIEMPNFRNPDASNYYLRDRETYDRWVQFRVDAVNDFLDELINGDGGVRQTRPDILVATWSIAVDAGPESIGKLREDQGLDAPSMIAKVRPDMHVLQTHWPDWTRNDLPADYVKRYLPFVEQIRRPIPELPLAVQTDIGSHRNMIRNRKWLDTFADTAAQVGFDTWTAYEYHLGGYIYDECPMPLSATRKSQSEIVVSFSKRIDEKTATNADHYTVWIDGQPVCPRWDSISVDGNRVMLRSGRLPSGGFDLELSRIQDAPDRRLYKNTHANIIPDGTKVSVLEVP